LKILNINYKYGDTAGQEKFYAITRNYYRNSDGIILCFDITDELTFNCLDTWFKKLYENNIKDVELILVGTKCDIEKKRQVNKNIALQFANELKIDYLEVSSKTGYNINEIFLKLLNNINKNKNKKLNINKFKLISHDIEYNSCC